MERLKRIIRHAGFKVLAVPAIVIGGVLVKVAVVALVRGVPAWFARWVIP